MARIKLNNIEKNEKTLRKMTGGALSAVSIAMAGSAVSAATTTDIDTDKDSVVVDGSEIIIATVRG